MGRQQQRCDPIEPKWLRMNRRRRRRMAKMMKFQHFPPCTETHTMAPKRSSRVPTACIDILSSGAPTIQANRARHGTLSQSMWAQLLLTAFEHASEGLDVKRERGDHRMIPMPFLQKIATKSKPRVLEDQQAMAPLIPMTSPSSAADSVKPSTIQQIPNTQALAGDHEVGVAANYRCGIGEVSEAAESPSRKPAAPAAQRTTSQSSC